MTPSAALASSVASDVAPRSTGKERDTESGNDYMFARYYNSATGRFLSPDWSAKVEPVPYSKLDNPQTLNLYAYVANNPIGTSDLDGHGTWYDASGNSLGSDGVNDNRVLIVQSKNDVTKNGGKIDVANSGTPMYSVSSAESDAINTSVAKTNGLPHEEGFVENTPGNPIADPSGSAPGSGAQEIPFKHSQPVTNSTIMEEHTHFTPEGLSPGALGGTTGTTYEPTPSSADTNAAQRTPNTVHVEANRQTTYFYDGSGVHARVPTSAFHKAPKKKDDEKANQ
jgi:RHS repeat-associated protein